MIIIEKRQSDGLLSLHYRGETIPDKNRYKLSPSSIELVLFKTEKGRWGDLEALKRKGKHDIVHTLTIGFISFSYMLQSSFDLFVEWAMQLENKTEHFEDNWKMILKNSF